MMELSKETLDKLAQYGGLFGIVLGILVFALIGGIVALWKANQKQVEAVAALQEKRIQETREMNSHLLAHALKAQEITNGVTSAMTALRETVILSRREGSG